MGTMWSTVKATSLSETPRQIFVIEFLHPYPPSTATHSNEHIQINTGTIRIPASARNERRTSSFTLSILPFFQKLQLLKLHNKTTISTSAASGINSPSQYARRDARFLFCASSLSSASASWHSFSASLRFCALVVIRLLLVLSNGLRLCRKHYTLDNLDNR